MKGKAIFKSNMNFWNQIYKCMKIKRWCACCGQEVDKYLPLPSYYEEMYLKSKMIPWQNEMLNVEEYSCPHCGAADRERAYALWMKSNLSRDGSWRMLDIAPARPLGEFVRRVFPKVQYQTADLFMEGVDFRLDIMDMKAIDTGSLDFFVCSHVLEHVADDCRAMKELARVLKPSGKGILVVPLDLNQQIMDEDINVIDEMERWRRFGQNDHVRKYSKRAFIDRIRASGLDVQQYNANYFGHRLAWENGLSPTATVYVVQRE